MARWTADEAREILARWRASGKSARSYGREQGIDPQRLHFWQRRLGAAGAKRGAKSGERAISRLVPAVVRLESEPSPEHAVVVRLPGGVVVELDPARVPPSWVGAMVHAASGR